MPLRRQLLLENTNDKSTCDATSRREFATFFKVPVSEVAANSMAGTNFLAKQGGACAARGNLQLPVSSDEEEEESSSSGGSGLSRSASVEWTDGSLRELSALAFLPFLPFAFWSAALVSSAARGASAFFFAGLLCLPFSVVLFFLAFSDVAAVMLPSPLSFPSLSALDAQQRAAPTRRSCRSQQALVEDRP